MTDTTAKKPLVIAWYRTPVETELMKRLHQRSDWRALAQSLGHLAVLGVTGTSAWYSIQHWPWWVTVALFFLHGTCFATLLNAVHEIGHNTVFRTQWLNELFVRIFAFFGWINFLVFQASHLRHHRYTLHPPDDSEVVLPIHIMVKHFFQQAFMNPLGFWYTLKTNWRVACGRFEGAWELTLFPPGDLAKRRPPVNWARTILVGHALIMMVSLGFGVWWLPLLTSLAPFYGGWLFFLCNNTQHIGLQDNVPDFRLCCRTFIPNLVVRFLYWHMNYHTEHHMYAAVPCYHLGKLHRAIKHDLPPCPRGIIATWREIAAIQAIQKTNPKYQHLAPCPPAPARA